MTRQAFLPERAYDTSNAEVIAVPIIIPVFNKVAFTRQCLDRIARHASEAVPHEISSSTTPRRTAPQSFFASFPMTIHVSCTSRTPRTRIRPGQQCGRASGAGQVPALPQQRHPHTRGVAQGHGAGRGVQSPSGYRRDKQLFPYTNTIHHTGIVFTAERKPQHIYPHAATSLSYVNKEREYQAVMGACLLIPRELFVDCGMFDEAYLNGYEDVDLCLTVRERKRSVVCCTSSFIYHYGEITETRTADDAQNAARFLAKWGNRVQSDELAYFQQDQAEIEATRKTSAPLAARRATSPDLVYFADNLSSASALTWVTSELALALHRLGAPVALKQCTLPSSTDRAQRQELERIMSPSQPVGGIQIRWSHYWPQHLALELTGSTYLELFVINYLFSRPGSQPWDYWLQCVTQNRHGKLPLSTFCLDILRQIGVSADDCYVLRPGYSPEIARVAAPHGALPRFGC